MTCKKCGGKVVVERQWEGIHCETRSYRCEHCGPVDRKDVEE